MPKKPKAKQVQPEKHQALIDALAVNCLVQQHREALLADEFIGVCLRIFEIYKSIGAPYVTASSVNGPILLAFTHMSGIRAASTNSGNAVV
jgi:hypothetical protein